MLELLSVFKVRVIPAVFGPAVVWNLFYFSHILKLKTRETRDQSANLLFDLVLLQSYKSIHSTFVIYIVLLYSDTDLEIVILEHVQ